MAWAESWDLTLVLAADPSSHVGAAVATWAHPLSREGMAVMDLFDVFVQANTQKRSKPKPYPRPWDPQPTRFGRATRPQREIRAALRARGHGVTAPPLRRDVRGRLHDDKGRFVAG